MSDVETRRKTSTVVNGTKDSPKAKADPERSPDYHKLIKVGLDDKVASRLDEVYETGKLSHSDLDERALDALKEFPVDGALGVIDLFVEANLKHVSNKSAYLCGVMKNYRQMARGSSSSVAGSPASNAGPSTPAKGPDADKIQAILDRTGYKLDVTTGQRKYGGPPPGWEGEPPASGCEIFCGKIPRDMYETDLIPLFEKCGTIWDLRLMMDPSTGLNRGYAFVTFTNRESAQEAVKQLDSFDVGEGKTLKINVSEPKTRLFIGNIPKTKDRDEIDAEFRKEAAGLREVIIYSSPDDKKKNRGFCFLEYESHKAASLAKRRLETGRVKVWSCDIIVDWADPQEEPDEETMSQVKVLYVRNLPAAVTEDKIREVFEEYGTVVRVKKIKDYAFVHFEDRINAIDAMKALNRSNAIGSDLDISLAKPPSDKKKKEEMLRKREQRMMRSMNANGDVAYRLSNLGIAFAPYPPFQAAAAFTGMGVAPVGMYRNANVRPAAAGTRAYPSNGGASPRFDNGAWHAAQWGYAEPPGWHQRAPWVGPMGGAAGDWAGRPAPNNYNWIPNGGVAVAAQQANGGASNGYARPSRRGLNNNNNNNGYGAR